MRKTAVILGLVMLMTLSGCGNENNFTEDESTVSLTEPATVSEIEMTVETTTEALPMNEEMPEPFSVNEGDMNRDFYAYVEPRLDYIDMQFLSIAGFDEAMEWLNSASGANSELTAVGEAANLYSFIRHFEISEEEARSILEDLRDNSDDSDMYFSDEEIDLLLSDDDEAAAAHFAAENAIVKGDNLYSPKWIYYHSCEDYAGVGITVGEAEALLPVFERAGLTEEAKAAIRGKINLYIA